MRSSKSRILMILAIAASSIVMMGGDCDIDIDDDKSIVQVMETNAAPFA